MQRNFRPRRHPGQGLRRVQVEAETQARPRRGRDVEQPVELTLEEAFQGTTRLVQTVGDSATTRRIEVKIPPVMSRMALAFAQPAKGAQALAAGPTATCTWSSA